MFRKKIFAALFSSEEYFSIKSFNKHFGNTLPRGMNLKMYRDKTYRV